NKLSVKVSAPRMNVGLDGILKATLQPVVALTSAGGISAACYAFMANFIASYNSLFAKAPAPSWAPFFAHYLSWMMASAKMTRNRS
ncbi:hypothetical protein VSR17_30650, partial [Cupriavidus taiwanensis]